MSGLEVDQVEKNATDADLTLEELTTALNNMRAGKTPGPDGICMEVYQFYWKTLGPRLLNARVIL